MPIERTGRASKCMWRTIMPTPYTSCLLVQNCDYYLAICAAVLGRDVKDPPSPPQKKTESAAPDHVGFCRTTWQANKPALLL